MRPFTCHLSRKLDIGADEVLSVLFLPDTRVSRVCVVFSLAEVTWAVPTLGQRIDNNVALYVVLKYRQQELWTIWTYKVYVDRPWTVTIQVWIFVVILIFDAALFNQSAWRDRTT